MFLGYVCDQVQWENRTIYGFEDGLEFIENINGHPNTFIEHDRTPTSHDHHHQIVIRIRVRGEPDYINTAKYLCYDEHDHKVIWPWDAHCSLM